jgi:hypothetical protein
LGITSGIFTIDLSIACIVDAIITTLHALIALTNTPRPTGLSRTIRIGTIHQTIAVIVFSIKTQRLRLLPRNTNTALAAGLTITIGIGTIDQTIPIIIHTIRTKDLLLSAF